MQAFSGKPLQLQRHRGAKKKHFQEHITPFPPVVSFTPICHRMVRKFGIFEIQNYMAYSTKKIKTIMVTIFEYL